jgi:hypothetical protein
MIAVTEEYERQLWEELNALLVDAIPADATKDEGERVVMLALMGHDSEICGLYRQILDLAIAGGQGYLRGKLKEDNPVTAARRRLYGKWANREWA